MVGCPGDVNAWLPGTRFAAALRDGEDLWTQVRVLGTDHGVRKAIEVAEGHAVSAVWPTLRVFAKQLQHSFVPGEECLGDQAACMRRIVERSITESGLGLRVDPVVHSILAWTRASASSPGTIAVLPQRTSS